MKKTAELLIEIGTEEIPASYMTPALEQIEAAFREFSETNGIASGAIRTYGTPRRMTLYVSDVSLKQDDRVLEIKGPPEKAGVGPDGAFTPVAEKFAASRGGTVKQLEVRDTDKGRYLFIIQKVKGRPVKELLPEFVVTLVNKIQFSKRMRWGTRSVRFARPVRWLLVLLDKNSVSVDIEGIPSGPYTYGLRHKTWKRIRVPSPEAYLDILEQNGVVADHLRRREEILEAVKRLAPGDPVVKEETLEEVNFLVESPFVGVGKFPEAFLKIPEEILELCIQKTQRYFPVRNPQTKRSTNAFVVVLNAPLQDDDEVIAGYERVLNSRLKDALFFYENDLRTPLASRVEDLKKVAFQQRLGSLHDKTERVREISAKLADEAGFSVEEKKVLDRAAQLAKADLTTSMVFEYGEAQGIAGKYYAIATGESEAVGLAIEEHYLPRFAEDVLPGSRTGTLLSLADKLDTVTGYFGVGFMPTGSADPFSLRRQTLGIIRIAREGGVRIALAEQFRMCLNVYARRGVLFEDPEKIATELERFATGRLANYMESAGYAYDVVNAALAGEGAATGDVADVFDRADAIKLVREEGEFQEFLEVFTRVSNIMKKSASGEDFKQLECVPETFVAEEERALHAAARKIEENDSGDTVSRIRERYKLTSAAHAFFDKVLVMDPDATVRANRLALLKYVQGICLRIADFAQIVKG